MWQLISQIDSESVWKSISQLVTQLVSRSVSRHKKKKNRSERDRLERDRRERILLERDESGRDRSDRHTSESHIFLVKSRYKEICQERFEWNWWRCRTSWDQIFSKYIINLFFQYYRCQYEWSSKIFKCINRFVSSKKCFFYFCTLTMYRKKYNDLISLSFLSDLSFPSLPDPLRFFSVVLVFLWIIAIFSCMRSLFIDRIVISSHVIMISIIVFKIFSSIIIYEEVWIVSI